MKHEPRSAIDMEKQLEWAHKLGQKSLGIFKAGQIVLAMLVESQIWHQLLDRAQKRDNCPCLP